VLIDERSEPVLEAKAPVLLSDQVDDGQVGLVLTQPQSATDLLGEDGR
jgi:hypothetical protein